MISYKVTEVVGSLICTFSQKWTGPRKNTAKNIRTAVTFTGIDR